MREVICLVFVLGIAVVLTGCKQQSQNESNPHVALVNGVPVTVEQYRQQGFYAPVMLTGLNLNDSNQRTQAAVEAELLYQEGLKQKMMDEPKVRAEVQAIVIGELLRQIVFRDQLATPDHKPQVSDDDVKSFYNANAARYNQPEMVHYAQILIDLPDKKAATALAQKILADPNLNQADVFAKDARQYSADSATANFGGDMGSIILPPSSPAPAAGESWQIKLARSAESISQPGGILPQLVVTERGLHIVKLIAHQPAGPIPLEQVRPQIVRELQMQKLAKVYRTYVDQLKTTAQIDLDQQAIADAVKAGFTNPYSNFPRPGMNPAMMGGNRPPGVGPAGTPGSPLAHPTPADSNPGR